MILVINTVPVVKIVYNTNSFVQLRDDSNN